MRSELDRTRGEFVLQTTLEPPTPQATAVVITDQLRPSHGGGRAVNSKELGGLQTLVDPYITGPFVYIDRPR